MKGRLEYSDTKVAKGAVEQFKTLLEETVESEEERDRIREDNEGVIVNLNADALVDTDNEFPGFTNIEKRELDGFLNPPKGQSLKERAFVLGIENNRLREKNSKGRARRTTRKSREILSLEPKNFKENFKVRESQVADITRLQKIKKWLKENLVGLSAVGISIAGIITTIIMAGRKALVKGGQALGTFGKAVVNALKSLVPVLTPLLNILATVLSWAAKGIAWLASNLWALVLFGVLSLYRWSQSKMK